MSPWKSLESVLGAVHHPEPGKVVTAGSLLLLPGTWGSDSAVQEQALWKHARDLSFTAKNHVGVICAVLKDREWVASFQHLRTHSGALAIFQLLCWKMPLFLEYFFFLIFLVDGLRVRAVPRGSHVAPLVLLGKHSILCAAFFLSIKYKKTFFPHLYE